MRTRENNEAKGIEMTVKLGCCGKEYSELTTYVAEIDSHTCIETTADVEYAVYEQTSKTVRQFRDSFGTIEKAKKRVTFLNKKYNTKRFFYKAVNKIN